MKIQNLIYLLSSLLIIYSCEKDNSPAYMNGDIIGFVKLLDEKGTEIEDKSGVKVSIENTSYSSISNEAGRFKLNNVMAGTYNLVFSKDNYGTSKRFSYQFVGGKVPAISYFHYLFQQPSYTLSNIQINCTNNFIEMSGDITETESYSLLCYINDSANVSNTNYDEMYRIGSMTGWPTTTFRLGFGINNDSNYVPGQKIYLAIYGRNIEDYGYYNPGTLEVFYPSITKVSDVLEVVYE